MLGPSGAAILTRDPHLEFLALILRISLSIVSIRLLLPIQVIELSLLVNVLHELSSCLIIGFAIDIG